MCSYCCSQICDAKPKEKSQKDVLLLKDYVLVPTEYANDMLKDHLGKILDCYTGYS